MDQPGVNADPTTKNIHVSTKKYSCNQDRDILVAKRDLRLHRVRLGAVFTYTYLCLFVSSHLFASQRRAVGLKRRRFEM